MRLGCDRGHNGGARVNDAQKIRIARGRVWTCKIVAGGATSKGMGQMNRFFFFPFLIFCFVIVAAGMGFGQEGIGPEQGGHEVQVWAGGGHSVPGGTSSTGIFDVGLRYGWVITGPHLPGFLRGRFEYAVDAEPAYLIFQPANTAYGVGFNPFGLKWNFERRGRLLALSGVEWRDAVHGSQCPDLYEHGELYFGGGAGDACSGCEI